MLNKIRNYKNNQQLTNQKIKIFWKKLDKNKKNCMKVNHNINLFQRKLLLYKVN